MDDAQATAVADAYYDTLANKDVRQAKWMILFSGVPGSGKSTVARAIEAQLRGVRVCNDDMRQAIIAAMPAITREQREAAKFSVGSKVLARLVRETHGLIVIDASCDRGYDSYRKWADTYGYRTLIVRMDVPRETIEQRVRLRGDQGYRTLAVLLKNMDRWQREWQAFGEQHPADVIVRADTPLTVAVSEIAHCVRAGVPTVSSSKGVLGL